jgi:hypothetical protein
MDLRERGWDGMDWIYLAKDRDQWKALVNTVMNLRVIKCATGGCSSRAHLHGVS